MDSEKLIESVRNRPILYQSTKKTYKERGPVSRDCRRIRQRCYRYG